MWSAYNNHRKRWAASYESPRVSRVLRSIGESPQEVVPGLFIGDVDDAQDINKLRALGIGAVLNVADFFVNAQGFYRRHMPELVYCGIPMEDTSSFPIDRFFSRTNRFIQVARANGLRVLVHCMAGISRSVTVMCAYLMIVNGWSVDVTLRRIRRVRPQVQPNHGFMRALERYQRKLHIHN